MHASVVIPTYNSRAPLDACLASLDLQRLNADDEFDVVVVDDGSDDGTAELVSKRAVRYRDPLRVHPQNRAVEQGAGAQPRGVCRRR